MIRLAVISTLLMQTAACATAIRCAGIAFQHAGIGILPGTRRDDIGSALELQQTDWQERVHP